MRQFVEKGVSVPKRDGGSFDEFMRSSSPRLLRLAWLLAGGATRAEGLVQGTLERVHVAWPRLELGGTHNYARRILVNLHTDAHPRWWREDLTWEWPGSGARLREPR